MHKTNNISGTCNAYPVYSVSWQGILLITCTKGITITFFDPTFLALLISSGLRDKLTTPSDKSKTRPLTEDPTSRVLPPTAKTERKN